VLHPLVQQVNNNISNSNSIIKRIEHHRTAAAFLKCRYPSAHSFHRTHHPSPDHPNFICKIHENHPENVTQGGR
jgi:hypothetical protein